MSDILTQYVAVWPQGLPDRVAVTRKGWRQYLLEWWVSLTTWRQACSAWPIDLIRDNPVAVARDIERKFFH